MTEPQIKYAKTSDGVSIAYWTMGEGMPVVVMPAGPFSHIQLEWQWPEWRHSYERATAKGMLVRYDGRGAGLSERDVSDYSLDARVLDLEAVVDRLDLERFALLGTFDWGPVAIAYAARCPQRVSHLFLWCTWAKPSDAAWTEALEELIAKDWEMGTETLAHGILGWSAPEQTRLLAAFIRECVTPEALMASLNAGNEFDVTDLLAQVRSPTLVLHRRQLPNLSVDVARGLASRIPDAQLALLEGATPFPWLEDTGAVHSAIDEFLRDEVPTTTPDAPGAFRTILFTDVEGSTALTDRLGDAKARDLLHEHERITREALKAHGGSEVKTMGDGFMASFSSATKALECAIAIQGAFAERNESAEEPIKVRIGLNAGEPIAEDDPGGRGDLFGTAVNMAARIAAKAEGGEILASNVVRELVAGKEFLFNDRSDTELRGFEDPVRVYEVRWRE